MEEIACINMFTCSKLRQLSGFFSTMVATSRVSKVPGGAPRIRLFSHSGVRESMHSSRDWSLVTASSSLRAILTLYTMNTECVLDKDF